LKLFILGRLHEFAVRIERGEHAFEGAVHQVLVGQLLAVHMVLADALHDKGEQLEARICRVLLRRLSGGDINTGADQQVQAKNQRDSTENQTTFHSPSVTYQALKGKSRSELPGFSEVFVKPVGEDSHVLVHAGPAMEFALANVQPCYGSGLPGLFHKGLRLAQRHQLVRVTV